MSNFRKSLYCLALTLMCVVSTANAIPVTYNYVITGDVYIGDETSTNAFNLTAGDTITAYGVFTADLSPSGDISVLFGSGSGNSMTIDLNGTLLSASDDDDFGGGGNPFLTFNTMDLTDFDFLKTGAPSFNSSFMFFDDLSASELFGEWRTTVSLTAIPAPAALWLFGSGLLGLAGVARKKTV